MAPQKVSPVMKCRDTQPVDAGKQASSTCLVQARQLLGNWGIFSKLLGSFAAFFLDPIIWNTHYKGNRAPGFPSTKSFMEPALWEQVQGKGMVGAGSHPGSAAPSPVHADKCPHLPEVPRGPPRSLDMK